MSAIKRITYEERLQIETMSKANVSLRQIAINLGRSNYGIRYEVERNGGTKLYNAESAQLKAHKTKREMVKLLHHHAKLPAKWNMNKLAESVEIMQMQIDILTEQLRSILDETKNN